MSWLSKKTGRPKEKGGHRRRNYSIDKPTDDVLQRVGNKSKFIEDCIRSSLQFGWKKFCEPNETMSTNQYRFKTAAKFAWNPNNSADNAILSTRFYFQYHCMDEGFKFRMTINEKPSSAIKIPASTNYTWSRVYTDSDFFGGLKTLPNQDHYTIEFQFKPLSSSDVAYVKDIKIMIQVADGLAEP